MLESSLLIALILSGVASAQGPAALLKDINPNLSATSPGGLGSGFLTVGATTFFVATDGLSGSQLWKTDGTAAGTQMIRQIAVAGDPNIGSLAALNGVVYFRATDDINSTNTELWRSDGTAAGTYRVVDINPGAASSAPNGLFTWNNAIYFSADDGVHGRELWRTGGTPATTTMVRDIQVGSGSGVALTPILTGLTTNNLLLFAADDGSSGTELYRTDGTAVGTARVMDINPGAASSSPGAAVQVGSLVFFPADDGVRGRELWVSDGSAANTRIVVDLYSGANGSNPTSLVAFNNALYYRALGSSAQGYELWKSNGTAATTVLVKDIEPTPSTSSNPTLAVVGNQLLVVATTVANGRELWRSDGTAAGTVLVRDIWPGTSGSSPDVFEVLGTTALFSADDGVNGEELWRTDLTAGGTFLVADIRPGSTGSNPYRGTAVGGLYMLFRADDGTHGTELWRSNGTAAGTFLLKDTLPQKSSSSPGSFLARNGLQGVFFVADDGSTGRELWSSDGTSAGTQMVRDINPGAVGSEPTLLGRLGDIALLAADDGISGRELFRSDGTGIGTYMLKDILPGAGSSNAGSAVVQGPTFAAAVLDDMLYFAADDGVHGSELWRSDGTAAGTFLVKDVNPGAASSAPVSLFVLGNTLYFSATEASMGREVWKSDGTSAGTVLLKGDVYPGTGDSCFVYHQFWTYGNRLVCPMRDPVNGYELWLSDGTPGGTMLVKDINPGTGGSSPQDCVELGGLLYFVAYEPTAGQELWRTDGTTAGTVLCADIQPGAGQSGPSNLTLLGSQIVFFADGGETTGRELWRTNGTAAGTVLVKDINPGTGDAASFGRGIFAPVNARTAVFPAADGFGGIELWRTDGTAAGTVMHADLNPGPSSFQSAGTKLDMCLAGSFLFFAADDGRGAELYSMPTMACAVPYGWGCPGTGGAVPRLVGLGSPVLGNLGYANVVSNGLPNAVAILFLGFAPAQIGLGQGCNAWLDLGSPVDMLVGFTNAAGTAQFQLGIPNAPGLRGVQVFDQAAVADPLGAFANFFALSGGLKQVLSDR